MSSFPSRAILTIDLAALQNNYETLQKIVSPAECAAVVKANAYGLGLLEVVNALVAAGCKTFFVASLDEAVSLREAKINQTIYVFDGVLPAAPPYFIEYNIRPVLNSIEQIHYWMQFLQSRNIQGYPASIHIDTGMNRLGLEKKDLIALEDNNNLKKITPSLIMSHLACADDVDNPMNGVQLEKFQAVTSYFPDVEKSLANSAGLFLGQKYHFDLVRAGISLYGGNVQPHLQNKMSRVVKLESQIIQIRECPKGGTVGYGATQTLKRDSQLATLAIGYADGYFRALSARSKKQGAYVVIHGQRFPIVGRISMDLITVDITDCHDQSISVGDFAQLIGPDISIDELAHWADTIGYEVLTDLGARHKLVYKNKL
ncbi:MAG: alanine racemase [Pseudomonadota bacterium]